MTRSSGLRCALLVAVLCLVFAAGAVTAATAAPVVILLSLDGVRHDYPDLRAYPGLARMQRDGVRAQRLVAGWPSSTFPGHVALATGVWADRHGILDNRFYDRALKKEVAYSPRADWIEAEPLWIAAERQGIRAATFFWVGSETDWHGQRSRYRIAPFDSAIGEARKVDQIIAWLDLPVGERPGLIMSYWHGTDDIGHEKGPTHPDIAVRLGVDPKKSNQMVRGTVSLPHGTGKTVRVLVLCTPDKEAEAKAAGADHVGLNEYIEKIKAGWTDVDVIITTPNVMGQVGALGRILGPRGLMPNPKVGTVTFGGCPAGPSLPRSGCALSSTGLRCSARMRSSRWWPGVPPVLRDSPPDRG